MGIIYVVLSFLLFGSVYTSLEYNKRLPPVAFDSASSELPQMKFETITVTKGRYGTYIKANFKMNKKQYFGSDYHSTWFVDNVPVQSIYIKNKDFFSVGNSVESVSDGRLISFDISTSLTPIDITNKTFKVIVRYKHDEFLYLKKKKESRHFYSYQNYEITFKGSDLGFPAVASSQTYSFDNFEFFIAKQSSTRKYRGMFGFGYDSDSSVNEISTSFEGFGIKTKPARYFYDIATRGGNTTLLSFSEISVPPLSNKLKIVNVDLVEEAKKMYHGLLKVTVSTTNRFNVDIKYVFELTSYLYNGVSLKEPFFPLTGLIITNFEESDNAEKTTLICRVFGFRNAKVELFLQTTKSDDRVEVTKNVYPIYNEYETVQTLVFVENKDRQAGTYFCVATSLYGEKVFKVEKRRNMFLP
ncbi:uncharacterized protein LOC127731093 [Mytilus californianus]|uniref:uncharacterized protein LOC127731093 n=1 Tax=Mytilus californianus TaxID=6549 RepID=UPI0022452825|nr:uncharacterized protein LOC127731093 [Mytilus californianus]